MTNKKEVNKKGIIGIIILAVVIIFMAVLYNVFRDKPVQGNKEITIEVINKEKESAVYELKTDAEFLIQAMEEAESKGFSFQGEEGPYGLTISAINGEIADMNKDSAYWSFYVNGDYCNYGVDSQPVKDGDAFKIEYTVYVAE